MNVNFLFDVARGLAPGLGSYIALVLVILLCAAIFIGGFVFLLKRFARRRGR